MAKTPVKSPEPRSSNGHLKSPRNRKDLNGITATKKPRSNSRRRKISEARVQEEEPKAGEFKSSSGETGHFGAGASSDEVEKVQQNGRSHFVEDKEQKVGKIKFYKRKVEEVEVSDGRKRIREKEEDGDLGDKIENSLYKFPMNRVDKIIRSEHPGVRISQEAVFVINKASEKFLELFSKEAYACALTQRRSSIAYDHLSSVVSKKKRFDFISDFVPEKMKAEDALTQTSETEKS